MNGNLTLEVIMLTRLIATLFSTPVVLVNRFDTVAQLIEATFVPTTFLSKDGTEVTGKVTDIYSGDDGLTIVLDEPDGEMCKVVQWDMDFRTAYDIGELYADNVHHTARLTA